ncbi:hypothetical protein V1524DRAFT_434575 [Lipomyces starkeyi]
MVDEAVRMLQNAGVGNDVTTRIQNAGHETTANSSRKRSYKEPDGLIIFQDGEWRDGQFWAAHRVFRTMEDCDAEIDTYGVDRQRREEHRPLGPLEYNGYKLN